MDTSEYPYIEKYMTEVVHAYARNLRQTYIVFDYYRKGIMCMSPDSLFLNGENFEDIREDWLGYFQQFIPEDEHRGLTNAHDAAFHFFTEMADAPSTDYTLTIKYHFRIGNHILLVSHKDTALKLAPCGRPWLVACALTAESPNDPGYIEIKKLGTNRVWRYDKDGNSWTETETKPLKGFEKNILIYSSQGLSLESIAERLGKSPNTIRTQKRNLFMKMGVKTSNEAISYAKDYNLI